VTDILDRKFRQNADAVESSVGDETVLLHLTRGNYYGLDEMGTRVWTALKEGRTAREVCAELAQEFGVDEEIVQADGRNFLEDLTANDLAVGD
jgi:hypothetical protein